MSRILIIFNKQHIIIEYQKTTHERKTIMKEMHKADKILLRREVDSLDSMSYKTGVAVVLIVLFMGMFKDNFVYSTLWIFSISWVLLMGSLLAKNYYLNYFLIKEEYVKDKFDINSPETWNAAYILYE